jgi:murein DD-endopeptidase MepM/ murein hydrolase activator NlpD
MSLRNQKSGQHLPLLVLLFLSLTLGAMPGPSRASVDGMPATPSLDRIEALFGISGLTQANMVWPVAGPYRVSSTFGVRKHPIKRHRTFHHGLDIAARAGTPIVSVASGQVVFAGWRAGYGRVVEIDHGQGWVSRYAHAKSIGVSKGQLVLAGQMIARVGRSGHATGAHLHLELERAGERINPMVFWAQVNLASAQ